MAAPALKYSVGNSASTTLSSSVSSVATTASITATTNFDDAPVSGEGMVLIDEGTATEELAYSTGLAGNNLTIPLANRGLEGGTAQTHNSQATVKGPLTAGMWNTMITALLNVLVQSTGAVDTTKIVTPTGTQTLTNKTLTSPAINTGTLTSPVINTGVSGTAVLDEDNMASNSATKLATQQSIKAYVDALVSVVDGWASSADTWVYASATSFTIAGQDRTTTFTKGTKIKLTQTTAKYFVVTSSSFSTNTTVNITGGSDYTLANAAITSPYFSYAENPQGYPTWFSFAPTYVGFSADPSGGTIRFKVDGASVTYNHSTNTAGTSNAGTTTVTLPIAARANASYQANFFAQVMDNGSYLGTSGMVELSGSGDTTALVAKDTGGSGFTSSGNKNFRFTITYEI